MERAMDDWQVPQAICLCDGTAIPPAQGSQSTTTGKWSEP